MDYLDEATLIWDEKEADTDEQQQASGNSSKARVKVSSAQVEFLRHFDKAENQLINISGELLATVLKISTLPEPEDLASLRSRLVEDINTIKAKGASLTYPVAVIDKLCFLYAVVIDEFIIYTEWGEKRGWENKTLLSDLFGMRNGGELFFTVAEKAVRQPHKLIDLIELIYLFINVGFKGQYRETGSEQLKLFVHQLEQIISQYRQSGSIYCHTKVSLPKTRKPTRRKRAFMTSLFFLILIATCLGLTKFWYTKTLPQRARDFTFLPQFSERYVLSGQVKDIVFISEDSDLATAPKRASKVELVSQTPPSTLATSKSTWFVQLATFSNKNNAEKFVSKLAPSKYKTEILPYKNYYRVIVRTSSADNARTVKSWYQDNTNIKPILVRGDSPSNSKEESK
ncbi:type IVB secretion system protein IcmH/DotU [Vibrio sp. S4M6]|uniref:type IVB secretion system protein IcmH/DotU n=1 Tax=Vibrio sinus TaxID=2946865 RepID=UPI002029C7C4|nr:type IVB secretion system protein IcmH/DotU [Vibrio sinus]MCL9783163.1 type IVB secretion system protein IcmH/DotU [Vibrio sinus]